MTFALYLTEITDMLPLILNQLGAENLNSLKKIATAVSAGKFLFVISIVLKMYS